VIARACQKIQKMEEEWAVELLAGMLEEGEEEEPVRASLLGRKSMKQSMQPPSSVRVIIKPYKKQFTPIISVTVYQ
jgi:hypothetical protein